MDTTIIGSCGAVGVSITILPTVLLIVSEVLGISRGKSNGIIHFIMCIVEKIKNKEPITEDEIFECLKKDTEDEIFECLKKVQDTTDEVAETVDHISEAISDLEEQKAEE